MELILFATAFGYLLGLALIGYVSILWLLRRLEKSKKINYILLLIFKIIHFCIGISSIVVVPAFLYGKFKGGMGDEFGIVFAVMILLVFGLLFLVVRELNRVED